ncbi:FHA domain-containing protein [Planosporangium thailandense]|uniref:FHA domain-containing protein n=1 Tax=Planosporangium thailandense TaxID=765197 RepID=A0ABX0Y4G6_9ACTN|nr:DUF1707 and FHA domain-containing protein [Planosporangium thailandense]NJC73292.1 FHA domain-containing protein [Planosporangium thailandense]
MSQPEPHVRASDRERHATVRALRGQLRDGRLSETTFVGRLLLAVDARRRGDLDALVADLPARQRWRRRLGPLYGRLGPLYGRLAALARRLALPPVARRSAPVPGELVLPPVPGEYVIGRGDDVDLRLDDLTVSRRHALVMYVHGGWIVADLGSRNGTWLNGWRLPGPAPVGPGDLIDLGSCRFVVVARPAGRDRTFRPLSAG